jgi:hypothetical protein
MKLDNASGQDVTFPVAGIARMQFTAKAADLEGEGDGGGGAAATLRLANEDVLVGTLAGKLAVDTAFDTIAVNAGEIRSLTHPTAGSLDVSVTLWDGST